VTGPKRILVTRPRQDAKRTAARLAEHGFQAVIAPVLHVQPLKFEAPAEAWDALLITSANAVPALKRLDLAGRPVFAVGRTTAIATREAGAPDVHEAAGDASSLADLVKSSLPAGARLLRLAGRDRKDEPDASLAAAGYVIDTVEAYEAVAEEQLPAVAREALAGGKLDGALHFSRRSVTILADLVRKADLTEPFAALVNACLSEDVAAAVRDAGGSRVVVAERPHQTAVLAALVRALNAP
jgi:uroporphyrinogen-III synthase